MRRSIKSLHRLHRQHLVDAEWGPSENNRRARFYTLTAAGRTRLREETANWRRYARAVDAVLQGAVRRWAKQARPFWYLRRRIGQGGRR